MVDEFSRSPAVTEQGRRCPNCHSNKAFPSRIKNGLESFAFVFIPFLRTFRCHACNWRGYMGTLKILSEAKANIIANGFLFFLALATVIYFIASLLTEHWESL